MQQMLKNVPREVLEKAVQLPDPLRLVYLALYSIAEPSTALRVAEAIGKARAYVSMRLNQLETMGFVKSFRKGRLNLFYIERGKPEEGKNQREG